MIIIVRSIMKIYKNIFRYTIMYYTCYVQHLYIPLYNNNVLTLQYFLTFKYLFSIFSLQI